MADEKKTTETVTETTTTKKGGFIGKILTGIICLLIGAGAMFGVDYVRVQDALDAQFAKQLISDVTAATVADTIANEGIVSVVITDDKKAEITAAATEKNTSDDAVAKFIADAKAAVKAAKEEAKKAQTTAETIKEDVKAVVEEVKDKVEGAKAPEAAATDVKKD